jgi:hypothetical protein
MDMRLTKYQLHYIPIMYQPLLDLLHPVRFLADVDQLPDDNGTPLGQVLPWERRNRFRAFPW